MSGIAAIEGELNAAIQEYLEYISFDTTLEKFNEECNLKGKSNNFSKKNRSVQKANIILNEMVQLFVNGQRKEFFRKWLQNVPSNLLNDDLPTQKLEFDLSIHFAIYPLRKGGRDMKAQYEESMNHFKSYIESRGSVLSQTTEFLPYFALPYAPNPQNNPGYQQLFSDNWVHELQMKLEKYLGNALKVVKSIRLVEAYSNYITKDSTNPLYFMQQQLQDAQVAYSKKLNKAHSDYHNLLGIAADLIDSLETTIMGKPVSPEYLNNIYNRLFNRTKKSIDLSRPGTAGDYIRKSLAYQKTTLEKEKIPFGPLDYAKLKHDLCNATDRRKLLILQALRWRLTKSVLHEREQILEAYISNDLLSLKNTDSVSQRYDIIGLLNSDNDTVRQFVARLLNTFASLSKGRTYLASNTSLVTIIHTILRHEQGDTIGKQNLLAALQKLSLRRDLQLLMINDNIISWLIELLTDTEVLSDYTLEYAVALLMNLCLRTAGKNKCALDYKRTLKVLSDLLGNSNHEIRPYVNGALYSVLTIPSIREHAKTMNLEQILRGYLNEGSSEMNTQIQFIINQINSNDKHTSVESDNEDDEEDEEDQDAIEADLDKSDTIKSANNNEPTGENLLMLEYAMINDNHNNKTNKRKSGSDFIAESIVLSRPTTPYQLRQSMMLQTRQQFSINLEDSIETNGKIENGHKKSAYSNPSRHSESLTMIKSTSNAQKNSKSPVIQKKPQLIVATSGASVHQSVRKEKPDSLKMSQTKQNVLERSHSIEKKQQPSAATSGPTMPKNSAVSSSSSLKSTNRSHVEKSVVNSSNLVTNKVIMNPTNVDESDIFSNKFKPRRGSDHSLFQYKAVMSTSSIGNEQNVGATYSFTPKYSTSEPRPSSANSSKSRNSSSSGTANMSDYSSIKKTVNGTAI